MTPGPDLILRLPNSRKMVKTSTIRSGNTCGGVFWTDGKAECPMLPEQHLLMVYPRDGELFWLDDCREVDREYPGEHKRKYMWIPDAVEPEIHDYRRLLDSGWRFETVHHRPWLMRLLRRPPIIRKTSKINRRRYLLTRFWWKANDAIRFEISRGMSPRSTLPKDFRDKLLELSKMLDLTKDKDRITAAEIARECGDFAEAIELLEAPVSGNLGVRQDIIRTLSEAADPFVRVI